MTAKATKRKSAKRASGKRETLKIRSATMYARRTATGQFKEMDEKGRSLRADRREERTAGGRGTMSPRQPA